MTYILAINISLKNVTLRFHALCTIFFEWRLKAVIYTDFNSFKPSAPFLYPLKPSVNQRFSGGIEMEHC